MSDSLARRLFLQLLGLTPAAALTDCSEDTTDESDDVTAQTYEYIVVGSGAGGGPLASNLAANGHTVLLLEAGDDQGDNVHYQVPVFHTKSTEDPAMRWDYFVKHYSDEAQQKRDSKLTSQGVLYPRAGTLGGCTAHNAMITVYPHASDWDHIAELTGDSSWNSTNMRQYFEILEKCEYLSKSQSKAGHGFKGWLRTHLADPTLAIGDTKLMKVIVGAAIAMGFDNLLSGSFLNSLGSKFQSQLLNLLKNDLNGAGSGRDQSEGFFQVPLATDGLKRNGTRELILSTIAAGHPLTLKTNALVTKVTFATSKDADGNRKATGLQYLSGAHLYRADPNSATATKGTKKTAKASREIILSAGTFNTPQLLKLSGVGPRAELEALDIKVVVDLPGVGTNLQDRYEVGVVSEVESNFTIAEKCTFGVLPDPCLDDWNKGSGLYTSNGAVLGIVKRSTDDKPNPDLFIFGLPGYFKGYEPGYSTKAFQDKNVFTWAVLKAHTENTAGTVTLRTADPLDVPEINFHYFDEGSTDQGQNTADLGSVVEGVKFVREIGAATESLMLFGKFEEVFPGPEVQTEQEIAQFVKDEAWGHHASCTCKIGPDSDPMAVLDSNFKVRGTSGLRVVDASVFPKIPGFFIVVPVYMISEKATDVLLADIGETRKA